MSEILHERPGVYSSYDASAVISAGRAAKVIGVAAKAAKGTAGEAVTLTGYAAGVAAFGEDGADTPGMSTILRLLFANGAATVTAVRVAEAGAVKDYQDAFAALGQQAAQILVCDSAEVTVQQALRSAVEDASSARMERIAVVGGDGETAADLVTHAAELNSERMVLVGPDALDSGGKTLPGVFAAAALAGVIASGRDPAVPLNGAEVRGLGGLSTSYSDNDIDLLVRGGVTPLESVAGVVSPVRGITTRTTTGGAADTTWRELTTILIVDDVIPAVRQALRSKFTRAKNTAQSRSAIRSQVIVELENKVAEEIIDSYGDVTVSVGERLSYPDERVVTGTAAQLAEETFADLSVLLAVNPRPVTRPWNGSGLPDEAFLRGNVPMTKEEVRALALSKLRLAERHVVWDVGAGTGSVSVECALSCPAGRVFAVEKKEEALALLEENRERFHAANLSIVGGTAPEALKDLPAPDRVFIGGTSGELGEILDVIFDKNPAARVVCTAVTLETVGEAAKCFARLGSPDMVQIAVTRTRPAGRYHLMDAQNPVWIFSGEGLA